MKNFNSLIALLMMSLLIVESTTGTDIDEDVVDCPLCPGLGESPQVEYAIFDSGDETLTCDRAFDKGILQLPQENCTFWQERGATICKCGTMPPDDTPCTLCEDGSALPLPTLAGLPGKVCAQLQVDAMRDEPANCAVWQRTIGIFCGCVNPIATAEVCKICGSNRDLKDPLLQLVGSSAASCGEAEFDANLLGANCTEFQDIFSSECCDPEEIDEEDPAPESGGIMQIMIPTIVAVCSLVAGVIML